MLSFQSENIWDEYKLRLAFSDNNFSLNLFKRSKNYNFDVIISWSAGNLTELDPFINLSALSFCGSADFNIMNSLIWWTKDVFLDGIKHEYLFYSLTVLLLLFFDL